MKTPRGRLPLWTAEARHGLAWVSCRRSRDPSRCLLSAEADRQKCRYEGVLPLSGKYVRRSRLLGVMTQYVLC
jgi:hypothetical protein